MPAIRLPAFAALVVALVLIGGAPAGAHTGFETSTPADDTVVEGPLDTITLVFTGPAEPTGGQFEVLDGEGTLRTPTSTSSPDGSTWILGFDPPLVGGETGVRWTVKAPDAHPIHGSFSFAIEQTPAAGAGVTDPASAWGDTTTGADPAADVRGISVERTELDAFLSAGGPSTGLADRIAYAGRLIGLAGAIVGIGALVFAATVLRGTRGDIHAVLSWVGGGGSFLVVGALLELIGRLGVEAAGEWSRIVTPATISTVVVSSFGVALGLRLVGGRVLMLVDSPQMRLAVDVRDPVLAIHELKSVAVRELVGSGAPPRSDATAAFGDPNPPAGLRLYADEHAWSPASASIWLFPAALLVALSYVFDGHTVTEGDRGFTATLDIVHVGAAAVWVGGVLMIAVTLRRRRREGRELRALELAMRFSVVASVAITAAGVAGAALAITILDSPSDLWATPWGRLLVGKSVFVALAAAIGAYNHHVMIPAMAQDYPDTAAARRFSRIVTIEALVLAAVVPITAALVAAGS